jgi:tetratricopeptide (TPR) repeat protein
MASVSKELFSFENARSFVENALCSAPLSKDVDIDQVQSLVLEEYPRVSTLLETLIKDQDDIAFVRNAFDVLPIELFGSFSLKERFFEALVSVGAFRNIVGARSSGKAPDFEIVKLMGLLRHLEGSRTVIERWTAGMRSRTSAVPQLQRDDDEIIFSRDFKSSGQDRRGAFENTRRQQFAIIERLKARDISGAQRYLADLIRQQNISSSPEHLGKSLSLLSQKAKELGVPELHIEWAKQATEVNPEDSKTFGHLADALIRASRFNEASAALDTAASLGAELFAENGRARILRETGRLVEARQKFLNAASNYSTDPQSIHSLAGAAEVLRDMGNYEESLAEYTKLTEIAPLDAVGWTGLASVLMDMGRFDEAISLFGKAASHRNDAVPRNGRATAYKLAGNFKSALRLYDEIVEEFPNDPVGLCGRAEVYRAMGNLDAARRDYRLAIERSPFTSIPISGLIDVLREQGDLRTALQCPHPLVRRVSASMRSRTCFCSRRGQCCFRCHRRATAGRQSCSPTTTRELRCFS